MAGWRSSTASRARRLVEWHAARGVIRLAHAYAHPPRHEHDGRSPELSGLRSILIVRLDEIGDVVLTSAFLRELRANAASARITLLVKPEVRNLVELCPHIDELLTFDASGPRHTRTALSLMRAFRLARNEFGGRQFDLAVMPRWDLDSYFGSFVARLSNASSRVTFSEHVFGEKSRENPGMDGLFTRVFDDRELRHEVERSLHLIELLGGTVEDRSLETWIDHRDEAAAIRLLASISPGSRVVALGIGAGQPKREWPLDRYVAVARSLQERGNAVVIVGGEGDKRSGAELAERAPGVLDTTGNASLRETAAVLRRCDLYIGNDAGPMHLASAAGIPVVEISCHPADGNPAHPNSPARFGPWQVEHAILQPLHPVPPCDGFCDASEPHCIGRISVGDVLEKAVSLLGSAGNRGE